MEPSLLLWRVERVHPSPAAAVGAVKYLWLAGPSRTRLVDLHGEPVISALRALERVKSVVVDGHLQGECRHVAGLADVLHSLRHPLLPVHEATSAKTCFNSRAWHKA